MLLDMHCLLNKNGRSTHISGAVEKWEPFYTMTSGEWEHHVALLHHRSHTTKQLDILCNTSWCIFTLNRHKWLFRMVWNHMRTHWFNCSKFHPDWISTKRRSSKLSRIIISCDCECLWWALFLVCPWAPHFNRDLITTIHVVCRHKKMTGNRIA